MDNWDKFFFEKLLLLQGGIDELELNFYQSKISHNFPTSLLCLSVEKTRRLLVQNGKSIHLSLSKEIEEIRNSSKILSRITERFLMEFKNLPSSIKSRKIFLLQFLTLSKLNILIENIITIKRNQILFNLFYDNSIFEKTFFE